MKLTLRDISKTFHQADEEISLFPKFNMELTEGEVRVLMGPSGCGKTTLLRIIKGLEKPDAGEVLFDDFSLYNCDEEERREFHSATIGLADQQAVMLPQLTALENVLIPTIGRKGEWVSKGRSLLSDLGLEKRMDFFPHQLSGGEQQRTAWARALILSPSLLLLDEPTSSLEQARSHSLLTSLQSLNKEKHISIVIATHNPVTLDYFPEVIHLNGDQL